MTEGSIWMIYLIVLENNLIVSDDDYICKYDDVGKINNESDRFDSNHCALPKSLLTHWSAYCSDTLVRVLF